MKTRRGRTPRLSQDEKEAHIKASKAKYRAKESAKRKAIREKAMRLRTTSSTKKRRTGLRPIDDGLTGLGSVWGKSPTPPQMDSGGSSSSESEHMTAEERACMALLDEQDRKDAAEEQVRVDACARQIQDYCDRGYGSDSSFDPADYKDYALSNIDYFSDKHERYLRHQIRKQLRHDNDLEAVACDDKIRWTRDKYRIDKKRWTWHVFTECIYIR